MRAVGAHPLLRTLAAGCVRCKESPRVARGGPASLCFEDCSKWHNRPLAYRRGNSLCERWKVKGDVVAKLGLESRAPALSEL